MFQIFVSIRPAINAKFWSKLSKFSTTNAKFWNKLSKLPTMNANFSCKLSKLPTMSAIFFINSNYYVKNIKNFLKNIIAYNML